MRSDRLWRRIPREAIFSLAFVALALQVLVPPGFMVSGQDGDPARIVICTGHGPVNAAIDLGGRSSPARGKKTDHPCAFAGHGAPISPSPFVSAIANSWTPLELAGATPANQVLIGRGFAAPPPARGPPLS